MMESTLTWVVLAIGIVGLAVYATTTTTGRPRPHRRESYTVHVRGPGGYALERVPVPGDHHRSPLVPHLAAAVDKRAPGVVGVEEAAPYSTQEVRELLSRAVVGRINARSPGLGLVMVSFDRVTKTVDAAQVVRITADVQVHSVKKMYSSKLTAKIDVDKTGREFVRALDVHSAKRDDSGIAGASSLPTAQYAAFEPIIRYTG